MGAETTRLKLPYPVDADPPNAPAQIKALAELVEKLLLRSGGQYAQKTNAGENAVSTGAGTYQVLGTPDALPKLKLVGAGGLIFVHYEALWKESAANAGRAAIFIGTNQLKADVLVSGGNGPQVVGAAIPNGGTPGKWSNLISDPIGLVGMRTGSSDSAMTNTGTATAAVNAPVGQPASERYAYSLANERGNLDDSSRGGVCVIRGLPEGEYEINVRAMIKEAGQTVTLKERRLTAWTSEPAP